MRSTAWKTDPETPKRRLARVGITVAVLGAIAAFVHIAPIYDFDYGKVWGNERNVKIMADGLWLTLKISFFALLLSVVLGVIGALGRMSRKLVWNQLAAIYVEIIRGTPLLVQIMIAYFCFRQAVRRALIEGGASLTTVDWIASADHVGILTLGVFGGAYVTEIVRGAIESIDKGQTEAALAQGMRRGQVFRFVLFPQAIRRMVPALTGQFVNLVKDSSLLSAITIIELVGASEDVNTRTGDTFEVYFPLALLYLAINFPMSRLARRLEIRLA